ncbi:RES family NAD+ phosphorylase [Brevibacterium sp. GP-SGM9]|uniref:RES family NAD+ phosphorylase n=1 Tax=Brevibacterium sp. GP-SGM9 TaxID=3376990 RepID=UPI0039A6D58D
MSARIGPEDLDCPAPAKCPVAKELLVESALSGVLPTHTVTVGTTWHRVYSSRFGHTEPNPGYGDARFSPFDAAASDSRVPTFYLAETPHAALLETVLRDVGDWDVREVSEDQFYGQLHCELVTTEAIRVADLRDPQLKTLGIARSAIASSQQEHYPCTRTVAKAIHTSAQNLAGIVWNSRQGEMTGFPNAEAMVLFADRLTHGRDALTLSQKLTAAGAIGEGAGRVELDQLLEELSIAVISPLN